MWYVIICNLVTYTRFQKMFSTVFGFGTQLPFQTK